MTTHRSLLHPGAPIARLPLPHRPASIAPAHDYGTRLLLLAVLVLALPACSLLAMLSLV